MSDTFVEVSRVDGMGMLTLRADLSDKAVQSAIKDATGIEVPNANLANSEKDSTIAWMSPDELMVFCPVSDVAATMDALNTKLEKTHYLLVDVSDARAVFDVDGDQVKEVLAKLTPTDVMPLTAGNFRRTRFGQVAGAFLMSSDTSARIICFRSVGDYMHRMLQRSAQSGAEVAL